MPEKSVTLKSGTSAGKLGRVTPLSPEETAAGEALRALGGVAAVARVLAAALPRGWLADLLDHLGYRAFPLPARQPGVPVGQTPQGRRRLPAMDQQRAGQR